MIVKTLLNGLKSISDEIGILSNISRIPRMSSDPYIFSYGTIACDIKYISNNIFFGTGSGCGTSWEDAILGTLGETFERYCAAFYDKEKMIFSSFSNLSVNAIDPAKFELFHENQFFDPKFKFKKFDKELNISWTSCYNLIKNEETYVPAQMVYLPFIEDDKLIINNTSTGLASHTNFYDAILTSLFEIIERDCFSITWYQKLNPKKIIKNKKITDYIDSIFLDKYEWHLFDITLDINVPTVLAICFGKSDFGDFVCVGSSTRSNYSDAIKKAIQEAGQSIPYFRYLNLKMGNWNPTNDFNLINNFDHHAFFYSKRKDLHFVFDNLRNESPSLNIDFNIDKEIVNSEIEIKKILKLLKEKEYDVLVKDITTPEINDLGFYSVKVIIPQMILLGGAYSNYFLGGKRLYEIPGYLGVVANDFDNLNKFPHPFP